MLDWQKTLLQVVLLVATSPADGFLMIFDLVSREHVAMVSSQERTNRGGENLEANQPR